jgi:hypothetical protein
MRFDTDHDGTLDYVEFAKFFEARMSDWATTSMVDSAAIRLGVPASGLVEGSPASTPEHEAAVLLELIKCKLFEHGRALDTFLQFDTDRDGTVNFDEFVAGLAVLGLKISKAQAKWVLKNFDVDHDGWYTAFSMLTCIAWIVMALFGNTLSSWRRPTTTTGLPF